MRKSVKFWRVICVSVLILVYQNGYTTTSTNTNANTTSLENTLSQDAMPVHAADETQSAVEVRAQKEDEIPPNFFTITFYKPTYVLPYYYTGSPYSSIYEMNIPAGDGINHSEMKYQLSLKVPIWKDVLRRPSTLFLAYTQLSYWQAYNKAAFFRETDYEPELFFANEVNWHLLKSWHINFFNFGATHQSNGFGGTMERSWNRIYVEAISSTDRLMISIRPWIVIHDNTYLTHNPNMTNYLGYGEVVVAYKYYHQVFSLQAHSLIEGGGKHATGQVTWSFPITSYLNGYVQVFSGYGQSLIEYNHHTNSAGIGISLSNWI